MQVYCPRCAAAAPQGQRFCKNCGLKLDLIVDAMEGRQGQPDPEQLIKDLRTFGTNMRIGLQNWKQEAKQNQRLKKERRQKHSHDWVGEVTDWGARVGTEIGKDVGKAVGAFSTTAASVPPHETRADRKLKNALAKKLPATRKYSLQQGVTQILGGAASAGVWFFILRQMKLAGVLASITQAITHKLEVPLSDTGLASVIELFWLFALIPIATGFGHLINGIFFAATPEELKLDNYLAKPPIAEAAQLAEPPAYVVAPRSAVPTNELEREVVSPASVPASVIEEETRRFAEREAQA
jgi:hypothetical protein